MIKLRSRISQVAKMINVISATNASIDDIESTFNKIAVCRTQFAEPVADYFQFDPNNGKLYLHTIEGKSYEVTITEV